MTEQEQTESLFTQIRSAHRLLASYYQRLLPSIERVASPLGVDFYFWLPREFDRPKQLTSSPFDAWKWDMLPGISTYYTFKKVEDVNKLRMGEYLISFWVISDTGVSSEEMNNVEADGLSLPMSVEDADSIIRVGVFTPFKEVDTNWYYNVWNPCPHPEYVALNAEPIVAKDVGGYPVVSCGVELPISQLITEKGIQELTDKLAVCRDKALQHAQAIS
ncbi:hypothetical protein MSG37_19960 [Shewanella sp. 1CM18E]|uniref:hypothetical protein n=1 Tax=Shewanella sp. 1CM18E TaxID=2929169 RepID=UPI0020C0B6A9|nr:hypothetical protein [Shewanella sp. 1CM18E]MCK8047166.1 hypothetical protein [Shewanella sp. 1CM18E]